MKRRSKSVFLLIFLFCIMAIGCGKEKEKPKINQEVTTEKTAYDEVLDMVLVQADYENKTVTLQDIAGGTRYVLNYNGGTEVNSSYGNPMIMEQLKQGELVRASFVYKDNRLRKLEQIKDSWTIEATEEVEIERLENHMEILDKNYMFDDRILVFSDGEVVDLSQIHEKDVLTFHGIGKKVCSVVVERGHGYVMLQGYDTFVDGWVEVGNKVIRSIKKDMILVVPEGEYKLIVEKNGFGGYKNITVKRDQELTVDISDLKEEALKTGNIRFYIEPEGAALKIAGVERDYAELISLDYGIYKMVVSAEGYEPYEANLTVDSLLRNVKIDLDKIGESDDDSEDDEKDSDKDTEEEDSKDNEKDTDKDDEKVTLSDYKVKITAPSDVEVYLDGEYKGVAPVNFTKVSGTHTITLRKSGYVTKTYTIEIDKEKEDLSMAFPELDKSK